MDDVKFKPSVEWMEEHYNKFNGELFNNQLTRCKFDNFYNGSGSNGRTLGRFRLTKPCYGLKDTRKLYSYITHTQVTKESFYKLCGPEISFNAHYKATQTAWENVLIHEMCHLATYMNGTLPLQGHGKEFRQVAEMVSRKSNGKISISRLASAEQMENFELDDSIAKQNKEREERRINRTYFCVVVTKTEIRLVRTTLPKLMSEVEFIHTNRGDLICFARTNDINAIEFFDDKGYRKSFRKYSYWNIENAPWLKEILKFKWEISQSSQMSLSQAIGADAPNNTTQDEFNLGYKITNDGDGFNLVDASGRKSFNKAVPYLEFDKANNEYIFKMGKFTYHGKPGSWEKVTTNENTNRLQDIIQEEIDEVINNKVSDNVVEITPNTELELKSPLEQSV